MAVTPEVGYAKGRAKRREILQQAMALFGEVGYRGASLREVAARCGLSHPGLLHHFPTKEALLQAVLEHRDLEDDAWMAGAPGAEGAAAGDPQLPAKLRRLVELVELNSRRRAIVELFTVLSAEATSPEHPAHDYFVRRYQVSVERFSEAYRQAATTGVLRAGIDPDLAARQLIAMLDGLQLQWLLDGGVTDMVAAVRAHVEGQLNTPN